ncbi:hypothetical protein [Aliikangiella coralliicola]|uniref:Uncharacterized protein n=1 Tax=Aliikangiella coralliicola TaxID=2592383 RepID=A0A545UAX0_9GAMM|nr:hypothetical protein [Aliikangiella coralliicola]TQV86610.1 hypothetical protein FLL46_17070 [Aliikangiella coralliicola]
MLTRKSHKSLSRRGSKLLVEVVIGVIGLLGIMLAQAGQTEKLNGQDSLEHNAGFAQVSNVSTKIDWLEVLF